MWKGWKIHDSTQNIAIQAAINGRFSLIAVACKGSVFLIAEALEANENRGIVDAYVVKDYSGNFGFSHRINLPHQAGDLPHAGQEINRLAFSNDGYALLAVSQSHWYLYSVYGHFLASGTAADSKAVLNGTSTESTAAFISDCCWGWSSLNLIIAKGYSRSLQTVNLAKNVVTQCYNTVYSLDGVDSH